MSKGIYNKITGFHNRRSIRLKGYDYSKPGYYFITICLHENSKISFGDIENGIMRLNEFGKIAKLCLSGIPDRFINVIIDAQQLMPDHVHFVARIAGERAGASPAVEYVNNVLERAGASPAPTVGDIVRTFKSIAAREIVKAAAPNIGVVGKVWQKNYYERIIRDEDALFNIRQYIRENTLLWTHDKKGFAGDGPDYPEDFRNSLMIAGGTNA